MEDKLLPKESHVWTLSDFIERRKDWDQGDEARLAEYLQQLSNKITQGAKNTLNELDDLVASIDDTAIQVANINNEFQLLADKQFIENKVQEEDETVQIKVEKPLAHEINDPDVLVNNIKEALKNSFKAIDNHFEEITVVVSDSDDEDLKHEETILRPKIFYKKLNLPSLSGNIQSEISVDNILSSDSDVEPPVDTFKDQESFSSEDVPEEDVHFMNESKSTVEPNYQPVNNYSNIIEPEKFKPKNMSSDPVYVENDLFSPPPLINDNDEDDLVDEYNIFSNGSNMFGDRNLWDDNDDDDADFEPPLPTYTDEPPQQVFKSNTQEKVPSIQQTLNDELRKRFQKDNMSSSSDNSNIDSPNKNLPAGAVNVLFGTDSKSDAQSPVQNIKRSTIPQISKNIAEPIQHNTVSDIGNDNNISNKLLEDAGQNSDIFTHKSFEEEIKSTKKQSLFEQESDDEDLFSEKIPSIIPVSKKDEPKQRENSIKNIKESNTIFSESGGEFVDSKTTIKEIPSHSIDNKSNTFLDSSSDDDLFNIKSSQSKSILKQKLDQVKQKSKSNIEEKNDKEILNKELKNKLVEPSVLTYNENIEKESIRNNNTLKINTATSSMDSKSKKLSYLFSSDEDDDIFFDVDDSNKNSKIKDQSIFNSTKSRTKSVKNRNEKRYGSKVELFDSSSDDEIFNTNKSNNNLITNKNHKSSVSNEVKSINIPKSLDDHGTINKIQETKNIDTKNLIEQKSTDKKHTNVFNLDSDDEDDDYLSYNTNISEASQILSNNLNINNNTNSMSVSSEEYSTPLSEPQYKDIFNNFPAKNKNQESFNEKEVDTSQDESVPSFIENIENNKSLFSNSDDEQVSFDSTINSVNSSVKVEAIPSNLNSFSENLPIDMNQELSNEKEVNTLNNETLSSFTESIIQEKISILSGNDDKQQLSFDSNAQNDESNTEIKLIPPNLDLLSVNLPIIKNQESLNEKEISTAKNDISSSSTENKIQESKSSIFSSSEDEQQISFNSNIQNEKSDSINKAKWPMSDSKILLKDSVDGSTFSSLNSKNEKSKKIPGKLSVNAGAFINVASLLPNSKSPIIKPKTSQTAPSDEKNTDILPTSGTKLFSIEKERARIQVKRRPPSRKARQLAIAQMSSRNVDFDQESNNEDSSRVNVSTPLENDFVDYKSSPILQEDNYLEVQNKIQVQTNSQLLVANDDKIKVKKEINNEVKKKTLDLFDDDSDPFESITEDKSKKDLSNDKIEVKIGEKQSESELLIGLHSDNVVIEKQSEIESDNNKLSDSEPTLVKVLNVKEIEENNSKSISQTTILPAKSNSLFDDDEDLFSQKSEKVNKPSSNIFDSDDEFEFNNTFSKKKPVKTKSIFGDDSDDDLFSSPSKPAVSNLPNQKQIENSNQRQKRSSTDGYVKLTAESVAINPLDESKNN